MAEFQHMDGSAVTSPITAVVGNHIHLKLIPGPKEALPAITASPEKVVKVVHLHAREKANFTTFQLQAVAAGTGTLVATDGSKANVAGPIDITVDEKLELPGPGTDAGILVRLFLAETPSPEDSNYKLEDAKTAMTWMRVVVSNRLAKPSAVWGSAGAKTLKDVVRAKEQFRGFSKYPHIDKGVQKVIDEAISIANDGDDPRRASYKEFVDAAFAVATQKGVTDPSSKGLYWWRTTGHGKPTSEANFYMNKLGNAFYSR